MAWLLDTNAWIFYLKNPANPIHAELAKRDPSDILSCSIVRAELLHGAMKYGVPERRRDIVLKTLAPYRSLPFDDAAAECYARLRHDLELARQIIGPNDLIIAAICLANNITLVTSNTAEFSRVAGLHIEDWNQSREP
jgi:tRNA(fMet)-specific endonuclease VapC